MANAERVKPLAQVMADGIMTVTDNSVDFSGMIVHPKEGPGMYMAPLDPDDPRAYATRLHEYGHLNLITSGEQPTGLHAAFSAAGIGDGFLQAMADAKVMAHCQAKGLSLEELIVIADTSDSAVTRIQAANKMRQANLFLRAIGTKLFDFVAKATTLTPKQKVHIRDNIFPKIEKMRTLEDWVRVGLEYQRSFETPKLREKRKEKTKEYVPKPEGGEGEGDKAGGKARSSEKKEREEFKEIAKKLGEKFSDTGAKKEEGAFKPAASAASPMEAKRSGMLGGKAVSEKRVEEEKEVKPLDVYEEKKAREKSEIERMAQELVENKEDLDSTLADSVHESIERTVRDLLMQKEINTWGAMTITHPALERNFEPKERSKKAKRSFVGAFRYPHRIVSDSAVFASKQHGKGGTLVIDGSGSMHISFKDVCDVLEQRPFATIAIYASDMTLTKGFLVILVDRGKRVTEKVLELELSKLGSGNVVDGPALDWLCKRSGEKFWICDGGVTGTGDCMTGYLKAYAALMTRRYHIKRWRAIKDFIEGKSPSYG